MQLREYGSVRAYELQHGDVWTIYPVGLASITVDEMEQMSKHHDIHIVQFWADGSISFQKGEIDDATY